MVQHDDTVWCDGCGVEIIGPPFVVARHHYCCQDCSEGFECSCSAWIELEEEPASSKTPVNLNVYNDL